jgi:hypothetical protein
MFSHFPAKDIRRSAGRGAAGSASTMQYRDNRGCRRVGADRASLHRGVQAEVSVLKLRDRGDIWTAVVVGAIIAVQATT